MAVSMIHIGNAKEPEPDQEPKGSGTNLKTYFVTTDLTSHWLELDDIRPGQLVRSRKIKVIFSGDLSRQIVSNPWFNGNEAEYLRCQIARITHNITIVPNIDQYKAVPESRDIEPNSESTKQPGINDCLELKNWVHYLPAILLEGRVTHMERDPGDRDPEEFRKEIESKDPYVERLRSVALDKPIPSPIPKVRIPAWSLSYFYEDRIYTDPKVIIDEKDDESLKKDPKVNNSIVCLRSLQWPGAFAVRVKGETQYYYFGWGHKHSDDQQEEKKAFTDFPSILSEHTDRKIYPEPNSPPPEVNKEDK